MPYEPQAIGSTGRNRGRRRWTGGPLGSEAGGLKGWSWEVWVRSTHALCEFSAQNRGRRSKAEPMSGGTGSWGWGRRFNPSYHVKWRRLWQQLWRRAWRWAWHIAWRVMRYNGRLIYPVLYSKLLQSINIRDRFSCHASNSRVSVPSIRFNISFSTARRSSVFSSVHFSYLILFSDAAISILEERINSHPNHPSFIPPYLTSIFWGV